MLVRILESEKNSIIDMIGSDDLEVPLNVSFVCGKCVEIKIEFVRTTISRSPKTIPTWTPHFLMVVV